MTDADNDRPNDGLGTSIFGSLDQMYEYVQWQLNETIASINNELNPLIAQLVNTKLAQAQLHLTEALSYIESGRIACGLNQDSKAKNLVQISVNTLKLFLIMGQARECIIDSLYGIRNNIVLLIGASTGKEAGSEVALIEIDLLNLIDFIEEKRGWLQQWDLTNLIESAARTLETTFIMISRGQDIDYVLTAVQWKLNLVQYKIQQLVETGKITPELADILLQSIQQITEKIELLK